MIEEQCMRTRAATCPRLLFAAQNHGGRILVEQLPAIVEQLHRERRAGRDDSPLHLVSLEDLLPSVAQVLHREVVAGGLAGEVGLAVDEVGLGGPELPDNVAA